MKASIIERLEKLEEQIGSPEPEFPPVEFELLIESEDAYFSKRMDLLRTKARELGYGDKKNKVSWFDLRGCDPVSNEQVELECLEALNAEERRVIETLYAILEKCIRLTANLSDEEKAIVKRYNKVVRFFGSSMMMRGAEQGWWDGHTKEELAELRVRYEGIMAEHGERIYE